MAKKSNNPEQLKKYTRELRDLIDSYKILSVSEINKLKKKYNISEEDESQLSLIIDKKINEANSYYEYGEWQKAVESVEEANYKDPFNREVIVLYYRICREKSSVLGSKPDDEKIMELLLKRLSIVDRNLYKKIIKEEKEKKEFKLNKLWFLLLLLLVIPIIILIPRKNKPENGPQTRSTEFKHSANREIRVKYNKLHHPSNLKILVEKSILEGFKNNYFYTLQFHLSSSDQNITKVKGNIIWYNHNNIEIFRDTFISQKGVEYYLNEKIPFSYFKTSQRESPDLDSLHIEVTNIESGPGRERTDMKEVDTLVSGGKTHKLSIKEAEYLITEGVTSRYLSLTLIIYNTGNKTINELKGNIEWFDEYEITQTEKVIEIIKNIDMPLKAGENRTIHKVFEIERDITDYYRINLDGDL